MGNASVPLFGARACCCTKDWRTIGKMSFDESKTADPDHINYTLQEGTNFLKVKMPFTLPYWSSKTPPPGKVFANKKTFRLPLAKCPRQSRAIVHLIKADLDYDERRRRAEYHFKATNC